MWTKLICFCLVSSAFGQTVPTHVLLTEDLSDPTHPRVFGTFPSTGADSYNVYEAEINNLTTGCPPVGTLLTQTQVWPDGSVHRAGMPAYVVGETLLGGVPVGFNIDYPDDPNPELSQIAATKLAGGRGWCYAVSSVVGGVESAPSVPKEIWLGFSAYYGWSFHTSCGGAKVPYPLPPSAYKPVLTYRDAAGVNHTFSYVGNTVIVDNGGKGSDEIEFHLPVIADDGTMIPLLDASANGQAKYFVELRTPDGYVSAVPIVPYRQGDKVYYNEVYTNFVLGDKNLAHDCNVVSSWWQDTSY